MREKISKSEVLLTSPLKEFDIIFGKMLPYLFFVLLMSCTAALILGEFSFATPLTILPLTICIFGISSFVAIISKTPKDMNFTLMFVYLGFFAYLFYPAMFYKMSSIAFISPIVSMIELANGGISLDVFLILIAPPIFAGLLFVLISMGMFKYDILFTTKSLKDKIFYGIEVFKSTELNVIFFMLILSPLIYLIVSVLSVFVYTNVIFFIFLIALIEEAGKICGIIFLISKGKITTLKKGMLAAVLSGIVFLMVSVFLTLFLFNIFSLETKTAFPAGLSYLLPELLIQVSCAAVCVYGFVKKKGKLCLYSIGFLLLGAFIHSTIYYIY